MSTIQSSRNENDAENILDKYLNEGNIYSLPSCESLVTKASQNRVYSSPSHSFTSVSEELLTPYSNNSSTNLTTPKFSRQYPTNRGFDTQNTPQEMENRQYLFNILNTNPNSQNVSDLEGEINKRSKQPKQKRTPRPPNAFILYRKDKQEEVIKKNLGVSNKEISCIIGKMWREETDQVRDKYKENAENEKKKHQKMYPDYKYKPRKSKKNTNNQDFKYDSNHPFYIPYVDRTVKLGSPCPDYFQYMSGFNEQPLSSFNGNQISHLNEYMKNSCSQQPNSNYVNNTRINNIDISDLVDESVLNSQFFQQQLSYHNEPILPTEINESSYLNNQADSQYFPANSLDYPENWNNNISHHPFGIESASGSIENSYISSMSPNHSSVSLRAPENKNIEGLTFNDPRYYQSSMYLKNPVLPSNSSVLIGNQYPSAYGYSGVYENGVNTISNFENPFLNENNYNYIETNPFSKN
ncbi:Silenced mating-type M-specific polypeptide Mc [Smittium culicis]|uniref:Silenced mating-type M-specific polypeptide Mc n=1 Tax=Smittium culicis TaxID=133412 RepID=A0A1R1XYZ4_9FUNG|nr:Silenced mating-type M-specific polypeptide Mc [Smittium culicis]